MKLEPANIVCPKCGNGNYMRHLIGDGVGKLDMKCINCNSYFSFNELYKQKIAEVIKPKTNADKIRTMSDEELSLLLSESCPPGSGCLICKDYTDVISGNRRCDICWRDWLRKETKNDD